MSHGPEDNRNMPELLRANPAGRRALLRMRTTNSRKTCERSRPERRRIGAGTVALIALIGLVGVIVLIGVLVVMSITELKEDWETYQDSDTSTTPVHLRNLELKEHLLGLVNEARKEAGAPPVSLGTNGAAQLHAEQAVEECLSAHWDRYWLKPYMRHSLMGGHGFNREVTATVWSCDDSFAWYRGGPSKNMKRSNSGSYRIDAGKSKSHTQCPGPEIFEDERGDCMGQEVNQHYSTL